MPRKKKPYKPIEAGLIKVRGGGGPIVPKKTESYTPIERGLIMPTDWEATREAPAPSPYVSIDRGQLMAPREWMAPQPESPPAPQPSPYAIVDHGQLLAPREWSDQEWIGTPRIVGPSARIPGAFEVSDPYGSVTPMDPNTPALSMLMQQYQQGRH